MDYTRTLTRALFILCCFLTPCCTQPDCTSVSDFDDCQGNTTDFCPNNIVCSCKDGQPFCKCLNFRGRWGNYWYMGAKCDQLWNTLDLVLVATLPGIGLAFIVGLLIQTVHYCQKKSKKNKDDDREQRVSSGQPHHNSAYALDDDRRPPQPDQGQKARSPFPQGPLPGRPAPLLPQLSGRNYNFMTHAPKENNPYNSSPHHWDGSPGPSKPEVYYGHKYSSATHTQPLFDFSAPRMPRSSYIQRERQPVGYSSYEEPEIPYRIEHI